jgi:hypothetical protein
MLGVVLPDVVMLVVVLPDVVILDEALLGAGADLLDMVMLDVVLLGADLLNVVMLDVVYVVVATV